MSAKHNLNRGPSGSNPRSPVLSSNGVGISRRAALRQGVAGATGLLLAGQAGLPTVVAALPEKTKAAALPEKAKAVIQIWMWGGPPHLDTFDPKPDAGSDYCGPLNRPIATNVNGIMIGQSLPELAKQADKYTIIRSMTHGINGHETASYQVQTGRESGGKILYPSVGAVVSKFKGYDAGYEGLLPPYIVLTEPQGRFSEAGFLGLRYKPFATGGDPSAQRFLVEGVVAPGITDERQKTRRDLLGNLNTLANAVGDNPQLDQMRKSEAAAYELILGDAGKVFDLSEEPEELRERYGRSKFGQSCLVARRLVEKGVRFVTINYAGWDTHKLHFPAMRRKLPEMDRGMASLFQDLSDKGLLDSTIVWWTGEFGRTPKVDWQAPWNGGRSHHGAVFSAVVAGGGFKGGMVLGASDARGEQVKDRPVYPTDMIGTMYELLGIDPTATVQDPNGSNVQITPSEDEGMKSGGRLKEIT